MLFHGYMSLALLCADSFLVVMWRVAAEILATTYTDCVQFVQYVLLNCHVLKSTFIATYSRDCSSTCSPSTAQLRNT